MHVTMVSSLPHLFHLGLMKFLIVRLKVLSMIRMMLFRCKLS